MAVLGLSSPWMVYYREVEALFKNDPDVSVLLDDENHTLKLFVVGAQKAEALSEIMPAEKTFGKIKMKVSVVPDNKVGKVTETEAETVFEKAFHGNPVFSFVKTIGGIYAFDCTYVVFRNAVIQYFTDDLGDIYGFASALAEDIARDIFKDIPGVYYCTDLPETECVDIALDKEDIAGFLKDILS